ncbi:DUF418 domain-containing protein [Corynebacterium sp. H78]|uniref:DUF418 domain-containing protein n=1 Tax=Corynebacterium sp. H78 TaxID=3133417 RepID=UPI0030AE1036
MTTYPPVVPPNTPVQQEFHHTTTKERILSPDIARGLMLLGIVVANATTAWWLYGSTGPTTEPLEGPDRIVAVLNDVLVHRRGLPMFATLFGFGLGMLAMRESRRGTPWPECRKLMLKRYGWLALFGVVHTLFLFFGDILLTYALLGMLLILLVPLRDKVLLWVAGILAVLNIISAIGLHMMTSWLMSFSETMNPMASDAGAMPFGDPASYLTGQVLMGFVIALTSPFSAMMAGLMIFPLMIVGLVAARQQILQNAEQHIPLLSVVAAIGVIAAVATGIPSGLSKIPDGVAGLPGTWSMISDLAGVLAGPGIIAAIALLLIPIQRRVKAGANQGIVVKAPFPLDMLQALGQRSLTGYVGQSILLLPLASAWGADIFANASLTQVSLYATGVWVVTLVFAYILAKLDKPGPFEALHRRLTYGRGENKTN